MKKDRKLCNYHMFGLIVIWMMYAACAWNLNSAELYFRIVLVLVLCMLWYRTHKIYKRIGDISNKYVEKMDVYTLINPFILAMIFSLYILMMQYVTDDGLVVFAYGVSMASFILLRFPLAIDKNKVCINGRWYMSNDIKSVHVYKRSKCTYKVVFYTRNRVKQIIVNSEFLEELILFTKQEGIELFL